MSTCRDCKTTGKLPFLNLCGDCARAKRRAQRWSNRDGELLRSRAWQATNWYGITLEIRDEMFEAQEQCCKLCGEPEISPVGRDRLQIEHCHTCEIVRGLCCRVCNGLISRHEKGQRVPDEHVGALDQYINANCRLDCRVRLDVGIRARGRSLAGSIP